MAGDNAGSSSGFSRESITKGLRTRTPFPKIEPKPSVENALSSLTKPKRQGNSDSSRNAGAKTN